MSSFTQNKSLEEKLYNLIKSSLNYECTTRFDRLTILTVLTKSAILDHFTKTYFERWFTLFAETNCFLELDYAFLYKLLSSSNLRITSEIEVFDAVEAWIGHKLEERSKYAKSLLMQVRFPLLSDSALKYILNKESSFKQVEECRTITNDVLKKKLNYVQTRKNYATNRYCSQPVSTFEELLSKFSVCYKGVVYNFHYIDVNDNYYNPRIVKFFPSSSYYKNIYFNIYKNWVKKGSFSVCVFMNKIYLIGGCCYYELITNMCIEFDPINEKWCEMNGMSLAREGHSSVVFSGRIVVSGGRSYNDGENENNNYRIEGLENTISRTVEEYDPVSDSWSKFPSMIDGRAFHQSVAIRNKLFVFGGLNIKSEVYDSTSKMFVSLKMPS